MSIQVVKKKIFFGILIILALFYLVNCNKEGILLNENSSIENATKELDVLRKTIDFSNLSLNEAQKKLMDLYTADFPKDIVTIKGHEEKDKVIDWIVQNYSRKTKDGKTIDGGGQFFYFKKGTKERFTGKIIYSMLYNYSEEYIKDGKKVIYIQDSGENSFSLQAYGDNFNEISYSFEREHNVNKDYLKANGITVDSYGACPVLTIKEKVNNVTIKKTYYYYDANTKKPVTKYEEFLPENFEYLKNTEMVMYEENNRK